MFVVIHFSTLVDTPTFSFINITAFLSHFWVEMLGS